jgi:hypothetical protein
MNADTEARRRGRKLERSGSYEREHCAHATEQGRDKETGEDKFDVEQIKTRRRKIERADRKIEDGRRSPGGKPNEKRALARGKGSRSRRPNRGRAGRVLAAVGRNPHAGPETE